MTERTGQFTRIYPLPAFLREAKLADRWLLDELRHRVAERVDDGRTYVVRIDPTQATRRGDTIDYSRTAYVALADSDSAELGEWAIPSADLVRDARGVGDLAECDGKLWRVAPWAWQRISNEEALSDEGDDDDEAYSGSLGEYAARRRDEIIAERAMDGLAAALSDKGDE